MSAPAPIAGGPTAADGPALGLLELATVARGVVVADAALKRAPAVLLSSRTLSGGKLLVVLAGGVAEVEEAMAAGKLAAGLVVRDVRLAVDLAGKAYFTMTGDLDAVDAAAAAAAAAAGDRLVELERIAQPAPELRGRLFF